MNALSQCFGKQGFTSKPFFTGRTPIIYSVIARYIQPAVPVTYAIGVTPCLYLLSGPIYILLMAYGSIPLSGLATFTENKISFPILGTRVVNSTLIPLYSLTTF